jgi:hypothetical protein
VDCILLATDGMSTARRRSRPDATIVAGIVSLFVVAAPRVAAQTEPQADRTQAPHVRPEPDLRDFVDLAAQRSPLIRNLLADLETLDVTVYVRTRSFLQVNLDGRVALLSIVGAHRDLVIELSCGRSTLAQMATLGHELFHALEIAREPSVVDARTLAAFYERIGMEAGSSSGRRMFESDGATRAGQRARKELLMHMTRSANGT